MRVPGLKGLRTAYRWFRSRQRNRALILGYHRVADPANDPYGICVSPKNLRCHLEELRRFCRPVPLLDLVRGLASGRVEAGTVALTFDDAYEETLRVAEPLLAEYSVPATVFVTTSLLGQEPWWDQLYRVLRVPEALPERLDIQVGGFVFHWKWGAGRRPVEGEDAWEDREELHQSLYRRFLFASKEDREAVMKDLQAWTRVPPQASPMSRVVTEQELVALARSDMVDVGSHTVSHSMTATLSREEQVEEVRGSRAFLQDLLGEGVSLLSYPHGSCSTVTEDVVREAGFAAACSSHKDVVTSGSNRFRLPRFWPLNSADAVSVALRFWLGR